MGGMMRKKGKGGGHRKKNDSSGSARDETSQTSSAAGDHHVDQKEEQGLAKPKPGDGKMIENAMEVVSSEQGEHEPTCSVPFVDNLKALDEKDTDGSTMADDASRESEDFVAEAEKADEIVSVQSLNGDISAIQAEQQFESKIQPDEEQVVEHHVDKAVTLEKKQSSGIEDSHAVARNTESGKSATCSPDVHFAKNDLASTTHENSGFADEKNEKAEQSEASVNDKVEKLESETSSDDDNDGSWPHGDGDSDIDDENSVHMTYEMAHIPESKDLAFILALSAVMDGDVRRYFYVNSVVTLRQLYAGSARICRVSANGSDRLDDLLGQDDNLLTAKLVADFIKKLHRFMCDSAQLVANSLGYDLIKVIGLENAATIANNLEHAVNDWNVLKLLWPDVQRSKKLDFIECSETVADCSRIFKVMELIADGNDDELENSWGVPNLGKTPEAVLETGEGDVHAAIIELLGKSGVISSSSLDTLHKNPDIVSWLSNVPFLKRFVESLPKYVTVIDMRSRDYFFEMFTHSLEKLSPTALNELLDYGLSLAPPKLDHTTAKEQRRFLELGDQFEHLNGLPNPLAALVYNWMLYRKSLTDGIIRMISIGDRSADLLFPLLHQLPCIQRRLLETGGEMDLIQICLSNVHIRCPPSTVIKRFCSRFGAGNEGPLIPLGRLLESTILPIFKSHSDQKFISDLMQELLESNSIPIAWNAKGGEPLKDKENSANVARLLLSVLSLYDEPKWDDKYRARYLGIANLLKACDLRLKDVDFRLSSGEMDEIRQLIHQQSNASWAASYYLIGELLKNSVAKQWQFQFDSSSSHGIDAWQIAFASVDENAWKAFVRFMEERNLVIPIKNWRFDCAVALTEQMPMMFRHDSVLSKFIQYLIAIEDNLEKRQLDAVDIFFAVETKTKEDCTGWLLAIGDDLAKLIGPLIRHRVDQLMEIITCQSAYLQSLPPWASVENRALCQSVNDFIKRHSPVPNTMEMTNGTKEDGNMTIGEDAIAVNSQPKSATMAPGLVPFNPSFPPPGIVPLMTPEGMNETMDEAKSQTALDGRAIWNPRSLQHNRGEASQSHHNHHRQSTNRTKVGNSKSSSSTTSLQRDPSHEPSPASTAQSEKKSEEVKTNKIPVKADFVSQDVRLLADPPAKRVAPVGYRSLRVRTQREEQNNRRQPVKPMTNKDEKNEQSTNKTRAEAGASEASTKRVFANKKHRRNYVYKAEGHGPDESPRSHISHEKKQACHNCNEEGHFKRECPSKKNVNKDGEKE